MTADGDVVDLLMEQHTRIEELFRVAITGVGDLRRDAFGDLVRLLAAHEAAEEEVLHPYARGAIAAGADLVGDRLAEERLAREQLAILSELGTDAPEFGLRLIALRDAVLEHAKAEERYEFAYLRATVDPDTLRSLAAAVRTAETAAPTTRHPGTAATAAELADQLVWDQLENPR